MYNHFFGRAVEKLEHYARCACSFLWRWEVALRGVEFEGRAQFLGLLIITVCKQARIVFGDGVCLANARRSNVLGLAQPSVVRAIAPGSSVVLGPRVGMSGTVIVAGALIEVGENTIFGAGAMVIDNDFHSPGGEWDWLPDCRTSARPVKIGRGVFVGARAIILKGVTIGDRAVIGAGAVVSKDVPPYHIAVGNPARVFPGRSKPQPKSA